jgi:serine/threonine-protein kinase ULK1
MTLPEIRRAIESLDNFYSDGVVFEGSMARCSWEAGMDIDSDSSTKGDESLHRDELKSHWSKDSAAESDIVFASRSPVDDGSHGHWPEYTEADWGLYSPVSSSDSRRFLEDLKMWESPRTPPAIRSPVSSSVGSLPSLPVTPNGVDATFGDRVNIAPQNGLTLDTECCARKTHRDSMVSYSSTGSSMMQTALDYDPYSSSFFLASSGFPSKASLEMPSTVDLVDDEEEDDEDDDDEEDVRNGMETASSWEYAVTNMSYQSMLRTRSFLTCQNIVGEMNSAPSPSSNDSWPQFRDLSVSRPIPIPFSLPIPIPSSTRHGDPSLLSPSARSCPSNKKSTHESNKSKAGIFKFFPRSPRFSVSLSHESTISRSRTPSPPPRQPWTFAPSRSRTPAPTGKRLWFSPGKLFAPSAP